MIRHSQGRTAIAQAPAALALAVAALGAGAQASEHELGTPEVVKLKDARLKIELNSTDQDAGVQVFIDAEPWKTMEIFDPSGRLIYTATARGSLAKQGGTELFLESGEPNFRDLAPEEFLRRFPEGTYRFRGEGVKGETLVGSARFSHDVSAGPVLVSPAEDAVVDPRNLTVQWQGVGPVNGSAIVGYQVLVVLPESGIRAIPKLTLDVTLPPTATSLPVPPVFLLPDSEYEWEVLAIESGGNQAISVGHFRTSR